MVNLDGKPVLRVTGLSDSDVTDVTNSLNQHGRLGINPERSVADRLRDVPIRPIKQDKLTEARFCSNGEA